MSDLDRNASRSSTTDGLPVSPSLGPALESVRAPRQADAIGLRAVVISGLCILLAVAAGFVAVVLMKLIGLVTNLAFYGRWSWDFTVQPGGNHLGPWVIAVPVVGGIIVGIMARYGSKAIRGHGIPEAMEQVLFNESRIPARITLLKPLSAAIAIGTGGPFGAEGPIIATGGALGSLIGQLLRTTADERKTLLAAGAAAGMAATFGSPVSAVLLAIELLLFEYRPRSIIPVSLAAATATAMRLILVGGAPVFAIPDLHQPPGAALAGYIVLGAIVGVAAVFVTRVVYLVEDGFEKLPIHWMWWPAIGAVAVGVCGYFAPATLGVGYINIDHILSGDVVGGALLFLFVMKFISWAISLGSGTSGGTLAPLFTIGGGLGSVLGAVTIALFPHIGMDVRIAALVGMAAIFAGASRALLASVVFAFETTRQPLGLLPLLGGCTAAYLVSYLMMRHTIMTEKIARRGVTVPSEYSADYLEQIAVRDLGRREVVTLRADATIDEARRFLLARGTTHQGFPIVDADGKLVGVITRREVEDLAQNSDTKLRALLTRPPAIVYDDCTLRQAADLMVLEDVGRLPVVTREAPRTLVGIVTRSDLLAAHERRIGGTTQAERHLRVRELLRGRDGAPPVEDDAGH